MAAFVKIDEFVEDLAEKVHNLGADSIKVMLTNAVPAGSKRLKADWTEIGAGNGYTAGGNAASVSSSAQTTGTYKLVLNDPAAITASGGTIGPFRYAVVYNDTPTSPADPCLGYYDYGSSITLQIGEQFQVDLDGTNGVIQLA